MISVKWQNWINLLRPKHWAKNLLVFAALIFSKHFFVLEDFLRVFVTFFGFCALASSAYILNDLLDLREDRVHPWKSLRPLASGQVSVRGAFVLAVILWVLSLGMAWGLGHHLLAVFLGYFLLQLTYSSLGLKHVVLLDVIVIACGFVLRAIAGAVVIDVEFSRWLLLCAFLLALFLALCKRRQELVLLKTDAGNHRPVLTEYSEPFIDSLISVVTGTTVVSYALYTVSEEAIHKFGTPHLIFTLPFVIYGIFRYLYLLHQKQVTDNPTEVLFTDRPLQFDIAAWLLTCLAIVYFF